jgi:HdeA/HdeB family
LIFVKSAVFRTRELVPRFPPERWQIIKVSSARMMNRSMLGGAAAILIAGGCWAASAAAQTATDRTVELFTCKDVMREPNTSREVAIAFLHGYLLGKSGGSKFNVEVLERQTNAFIEECLDNPQSKAADVMAKLKK